MNPGDTIVLGKEGMTNGSSIFGVSIRAWVVITTTAAILGAWLTNCVFNALGYTSATFSVPEPIYTVWIAVISYYFGTLKK